MKVKIKATGFGATALKDGTILHFDKSEADKPKAQRDMRKLQAEVEIDDANRIKELGWGDFASKDDEAVAIEGDRAELGDEVQKLEQAPEVEQGKPAQKAPPADRDHPSAQVRRANAARPKRPSELKKQAAKNTAQAGGAPAVETKGPAAQTEDGQDGGEGGEDGQDNAGGEDPDAGPKT